MVTLDFRKETNFISYVVVKVVLEQATAVSSSLSHNMLKTTLCWLINIVRKKMLRWNKKSRGSWSKVAFWVIFWGESVASIKIVVSHILICDWKFLAKSLCLYICCKRRKKKSWFTCWSLVERCTICYFLSPFWIKLRNMHTSHHWTDLGKIIYPLCFLRKKYCWFLQHLGGYITPWSTISWKNYR